MNSKRSVLTIVVLICFAVAVQAKDDYKCVIPIGSKQFYRHQWPLIYKTNGELYPTSTITNEEWDTVERQVTIGDSDLAILSCGPNYFKNYFQKEVLNVRCNANTGNFTVWRDENDKNLVDTRNVEKSIFDLSCDLRVIEEVIDTVNGCDGKYTSTNFGYVDPTEKQTYILGEACYDENVGKTIFAHVKLGKDKSSNYLRKVDKSYLTTGKHPDGRYKIALFRGLRFDELYQRMRQQLNIKHAPLMQISNYVDELLLGNEQFQAVKKLGWNYYLAPDKFEVLDTLKQDIKSLSSKVNLDIYTGGHGVNILEGPNGETMAIYLQEAAPRTQFPMPALIWIVVQHDTKAIAFAVPNQITNELIEEREASPKLCDSKCEKVSWLSTQLRHSSLLCCSYQQLRSGIEEIPALVNVRELLL